MAKRHHEKHSIEKINWLRASVLGANDGIVSTSCLVLGVASAHATHASILLTGVAGLVAGAMSMATGEYVSVHSQVDIEQAALAEEQAELDQDYHGEQRELTAIYMRRGLDFELAGEVAVKLMEHDALAAHARDELGINHLNMARPLQAAVVSAGSFSCGAILPLAVVVISPEAHLLWLVSVAALVFLAMLGALAARMGSAKMLPGAIRVTFWSALAMAVTAGVGALFGTLV
ncbi:VIT family protein [Herbaspirillum sp. RTI4]|uniref:VIT1/CCC1 transporter family protein n=1 Tax=Herbaspirillum sp. RTI4 TaxID=3048640 RepID=UPI002AB33460|nr:VIT family protein [Herbaspirillum sp. RTI4]MDY7579135.1 VIT family protein [Herbaspirillum sp. RTI4]MEA9981286.1 VIT family protein [Herbaspirillum sp. RTI4]